MQKTLLTFADKKCSVQFRSDTLELIYASNFTLDHYLSTANGMCADLDSNFIFFNAFRDVKSGKLIQLDTKPIDPCILICLTVDQLSILKEKYKADKLEDKVFYGFDNIKNNGFDLRFIEREELYVAINEELESQRKLKSYSKQDLKIIDVSGPPGIGKTRFLVEFKSEMQKINPLYLNENEITIIGVAPQKWEKPIVSIQTALFKDILGSLNPNHTIRDESSPLDVYTSVVRLCNNPKRILLLIDEINEIEDLAILVGDVHNLISCSFQSNCPLSVIFCGTLKHDLGQAIKDSKGTPFPVEIKPISLKGRILLLNKINSLKFVDALSIAKDTGGIPRLIHFANKELGADRQNAVKACQNHLERMSENYVSSSNIKLISSCLFGTPYVEIIEGEFKEFIRLAACFGSLEAPILPPIYIKAAANKSKILPLYELLKVRGASDSSGVFFENLCFNWEIMIPLIFTSLSLKSFYFLKRFWVPTLQTQVFKSGVKIEANAVVNGKFEFKATEKYNYTTFSWEVMNGKCSVGLEEPFIILNGNSGKGFDILVNKMLQDNKSHLFFYQCKFRSANDLKDAEIQDNYLSCEALMKNWFPENDSWSFVCIASVSKDIGSFHKAVGSTQSAIQHILFLTGTELVNYFKSYLSEYHGLEAANEKIDVATAMEFEFKNTFGSGAKSVNALKKREEIWVTEHRLMNKADLQGCGIGIKLLKRIVGDPLRASKRQKQDNK